MDSQNLKKKKNVQMCEVIPLRKNSFCCLILASAKEMSHICSSIFEILKDLYERVLC